MTKYLLNSGGTKHDPELARKFFAAMAEGLNSPRVLICCFAQPREDWEGKFIEDTASLPDLFPDGIRPTFELAFPASFEQQIKNSDAVFIHGGDDHLLQYWLKKFDIPKIWDEKVVATSSASSHALVKHFWTCDWRQCMEGLGILPIKFLAHYQSAYGVDDSRGPVDWEKGYKELEAHGDTSLPIYALHEGEFVAFEK